MRSEDFRATISYGRFHTIRFSIVWPTVLSKTCYGWVYVLVKEIWQFVKLSGLVLLDFWALHNVSGRIKYGPLSLLTNTTIFTIFFATTELTYFFKFSTKPIILSFTIHNLPPWQFVTMDLFFMIGLKSKLPDLNRWLLLRHVHQPTQFAQIIQPFLPRTNPQGYDFTF